jgi:hypothetical protein
MAGFFDLDLEAAGRDLANKLTSPFDKILNANDLKNALAEANKKNDFPGGFIFKELREEVEGEPLQVTLINEFMPHDSFTSGGEQRIQKDYYPGNPEPTVQVLGPKESDITLRGRLKVKKFQFRNASITQEEARRIPLNLRNLMENVRQRGYTLEITLGGFTVYGHLVKTEFSLKTFADIDYSITFSIIGPNKPSTLSCKIDNTQKKTPYELSNTLKEAMAAYEANYSTTPPGMDQSLADQIKGKISDVAAAVATVTDFVDNFLDELDDLRSAVDQATGLVKNTRNKILSYGRTIGAINAYGGVPIVLGTGISLRYINATFISDSLSDSYSLLSIVAQFEEQIAAIAATEPLARHRVQDGDNLQRLSMKYYNDSSLWQTIFDHNKLTDTELEIGSVLEIPRT